ncbi:MAG TPA: antitoxin Xre-like helix-turn-helix domain-containing protein [Candidatus Angelobacter sp.]|nr:antitoxin Xre-like helix-turn-helix domain-containing protein [Candidatus Angelobacter sp.]
MEISANTASAWLQHPVAGFRWDVAADLSSREVQERLSPAAIRAFLKIADAWKLKDADARNLLGGISNGSFYDLKAHPDKRLDQDRLTRISLIVGTFKALNILYSRKLADSWISLPNSNPMFGGDTPLNYVVRGGVPALVKVRQLLDARRGGR